MSRRVYGTVFARLFIAGCCAAILCLAYGPATLAQQNPELTVVLSEGELLKLDEPAVSVLLADPEIADVQLPSPQSVFVFGRQPGATTLYVLGEGDAILAARRIVVIHDVVRLNQLIRSRVPNAEVTASSTPSGLVLDGSVPTADEAQRIQALAASFLGADDQILTQYVVTSPTQVNIRVRVAEMDRAVSQAFGFNWNAVAETGNFAFGLITGRGGAVTNGPELFFSDFASELTGTVGAIGGNFSSSNVDATAVLDILAEEGLVSLMAEPNLTARSGDTASFFAGGEFPIPVAQSGTNDAITIEFKRFGVLLDLVPTVISSNRISMRVRPEVSDLSDNGAINTTEGLAIPALRVRRAETTIEMASGQSFAIAGLLQDDSASVLSKIPGIGDVPMLGQLFQSSRFQRGETELVIIATAYVVRPNDPGDFGTPLDGFRPAREIDRILTGNLATPGQARGLPARDGTAGTRLIGPAGFYY
ncbi:MAG: type II and III secretion system protein family protein [Alphaproteobacteria bacterium]|nr:type II and III secretion system protein family protein [Alphaproteobacteria bacterium]